MEGKDTLRTFLAELNRGEHDDVLDLLNDSVKNRVRLNQTFGNLTAEDVRQAQLDSEDGVARVVFNQNARPKYLYEEGVTAEVLKINNKSVKIKLIDPNGRAAERFGGTSSIRCPLSIIDIL